MSALHGLQARIEDFDAMGTRIIAVSPDSVEQNLKVAFQQELDFPILSDSKLELSGALGLVHDGGGISSDRPDIPRPAVFIVKDGVIRWRALTDNWRVRVQAGPLLEELERTLGGG